MSISADDGFTGVEVRHLAALRAIAQTRSFSRAAERLGYAQSAVSQQIAALERAVGLPLVERPGGPKPVSLTEAGAILARHGDRILARLGAARADLAALAAGAAGTVRVGTFQSAGARLLPLVLKRYRERWPAVRVELTERRDDRELLEMVAGGGLDLAFAVLNGREEEEGFETVDLVEDHYVLLAPPTSRFADMGCVPLAALDGEDIISFPEGESCAVGVESAWRRAGITPEVIFRSDDNLIVQRLVATGLGHALVPRMTVEREEGPDAALVLCVVDEIAPRQIGIAWRRERHRSAAVQAFAETAVEVCARAETAA